MLRKASFWLYVGIMLALMVGTLRVHLFYGHVPALGLILLPGGLWALSVEGFRKKLSVVTVNEDRRRDLQDALALVIAALLTHVLVVWGFSSVEASAAVGLAFGLFLPSVGVAAFCGSFVGMLSPHLYGFFGLVLAALFAAILFQTGRGTFKGIGGKLGTTAFFGSVLAALVVTPESFHFFRGGIDLTTRFLTTRLDLWVIGLSALGALATFWLADRFGLTVVITSSVVGLSGALLLPFFFGGQGDLMAVAVYCASFAGMTAKEHLKEKGWYLLAGALSGGIFLLGLQIFVGFGGKLGTTAMISVLAVRSLRELGEKSRKGKEF